MMRQFVAVLVSIAYLLVSNPAFASANSIQKATESQTSLKQQVPMIPTGGIIEVKLLQKGRKRITGKLGSVTDEGFEVQTVRSGNVVSEKIAFADVKSVKEKRGMSVTRALVVTGVVCGVLMLIGVIAGAARGWEN
jgi:hypothetical protein